jgi:hypothetical protein
MHGEKRQESLQKSQLLNNKEWFNSLKSAIVSEDLNYLETLSQRELPEFFSIEEMKDAQFLIREALIYLVNFRDEVGQNMEKVERNIKSMKALLEPQHHFDKKI